VINSIATIIKEAIEERHQRDTKQLEVVFSPSKRILVEAPAGYGKTNTMVSKIAYLLATKQIPYPKRLLALTFSVNAAYKIKKDVSLQIPNLLEDTGLNINVSDKVFVSNYHGFCRNILKKYGNKFHASLSTIDTLQSVEDSDPRKMMRSVKGLSSDDARLLSKFNDSVKKTDVPYLEQNINQYNEIVINHLLPQEVIPYNAILTLTLKLFTDFPKILEFYQRYFTTILVDEYQDTNTLSYWLIEHLITDQSNVILLGDSLQRIYGFIGAVPDLLSNSEKEFGLTKIQLEKNYRFASNPEMLQLDLNIRKNAENSYMPSIDRDAKIKLKIATDQNEESQKVAEKANKLVEEDPGSRVAILVKQRGPNIELIIKTFEERSIPYFFALFTDENPAYMLFHRKCLFEFIELIKTKSQVTKKLCKIHFEKIKEIYKLNLDPSIKALTSLLEIFWVRLFSDFAYLENEEKIILVKDTFEHYSLRQYVEFTDAKIIISTVHGAKGLEWDYVILPDMEEGLFPNWFGLCEVCECNSDCKLVVAKENEKQFLEELSVFYVAVTRAKKQVYFSASETQLDRNNIQRVKKVSCFLKLPGIAWS
jgi:DNA helicase II / ATP-dependent DNA helicase PcrA